MASLKLRLSHWWLLCITAVCGVLVFPGMAVRADDLEDLRSRLERVEEQNAELRDRLDRASKTSVAEPLEAEASQEDSVDAELIADTKVKDGAGDKDKPPAEPDWHEVGSDMKMSATWKNGLEFESKNKDFKVHFGGRTQMDLAFFESENVVQFGAFGTGPIRDGFDFRRARLRADGTMWEQVEWVVEYDFMNAAGTAAAPAPTDGYFTFTKLPWVGNFRVGLHKDPIGFEHLTSSRYLSFMERSFNQDIWTGGFNNGFSPGLMIFDNYDDERGTWWLGVYKMTNNAFQFNTGGGEFAVTGRVTYLPWYVDEGRGLIHVGAAVRHLGMDDGTVRYRTRGPERAGLGGIIPNYADTGVLQGDSQNQLNAEFAAVFGPLNFQADYLFSTVEDAFRAGDLAQRTVFYHGGYIEALYFLTGEHRVYSLKNAVFERVSPTENFFCADSDCRPVAGRGAWQVGVRYNHLDLNDKGLNGGILNDVTCGLNWFLNPNLKVQANYSITHRESRTRLSDGWIQGLGFRLAHDF